MGLTTAGRRDKLLTIVVLFFFSRWQHLSHALSKSAEIVQTLQQSAWRDLKNRPLQAASVWQPLILTLA